MDDGTSTYTYSIDTGTSTSADKILDQGKYFQSLLQNNVLTCAENLGSTGNDIGILLISENLLSVDLTRSWYITMTGKGYCMDVEYNSQIYVTFYVQSKAVYLIQTTTTYSGTSI